MIYGAPLVYYYRRRPKILVDGSWLVLLVDESRRFVRRRTALSLPLPSFLPPSFIPSSLLPPSISHSLSLFLSQHRTLSTWNFVNIGLYQHGILSKLIFVINIDLCHHHRPLSSTLTFVINIDLCHQHRPLSSTSTFVNWPFGDCTCSNRLFGWVCHLLKYTFWGSHLFK